MKVFLKLCKWFFLTFGVLSFLFFALSFTDIPYYAYHNLGVSHTQLTEKPDVILLLGGSGMPSPDGFIRTYYTAKAANEYKDADIIIALPYTDGDSLYQLDLMAHELIINGVDSSRIRYEPKGHNTRSQALNMAAMFKDDKEKLAFLIITTPDHMYRSVRTYKKVGFTNIGGIPTFEKPIDESKLLGKDSPKGINLSLRYNMWSYLTYELLVLREYTAIAYYKIKGWI